MRYSQQEWTCNTLNTKGQTHGYQHTQCHQLIKNKIN